MLRLTNKIKIGDYEFNYVSEVEVNSSWETLTDTATITIPQKITFRGKPIIDGSNSVFKIGDKVEIWCGYDYEHDLIFEGFLTRLRPDKPLVIEAECKMWLFKKMRYTKSFKSVTLKELVNFLVDGVRGSKFYQSFDVDCSLDVNLGQFRIDDATGAEILDELREKYKIYSYFRGNTLFVGLPYLSTGGYSQTVTLDFRKDIISDTLEFKNPDNAVVHIKVKDKKFRNTDKELIKHIQEQQELQTTQTLTGSIQTYGKPYLKHGDRVELINVSYPEKSGKYIIKNNTITFGQSGYRQEMTIDLKVS